MVQSTRARAPANWQCARNVQTSLRPIRVYCLTLLLWVQGCIRIAFESPFANCSEKSAIASIVSQILSLNFVSQKKSDSNYTRGKKEIHPYYISPIEMRSLWMEIKCVKSATRLLDRIWVNKGGLDLSKEVLWVSVGQRAAVLQAVKVGGQKKILPISQDFNSVASILAPVYKELTNLGCNTIKTSYPD